MKKSFCLKSLLIGLGALCASTAGAQVTVDIDCGSRGPAIGYRHYGIFFEEINHAGDGGLYAELVQNRSFEDASTPTAWSTIGSASMKIVTDNLLNDAQQRALEVKFTKAGDGFKNSGFWGMNIVEGNTYKLSFWCRFPDGVPLQMKAQLQGANGANLGESAISMGELSTQNPNWQKFTAEIVATGSDSKGALAIISEVPLTMTVDVVSLFPPTYKDRPNGCRPDLAQMLADMKPAFMRFPGGCFVEGCARDGSTNRFEWKKTIGPIENRPGHQNVNWNYRVSDGLGFHEMLQLAEDLNAEPLYVVNVGMGHYWCYDYQTEIEPFIQEALDAIEYCNGSTDTYWGAQRAANGHPEPFRLKLLEIGNENYNFNFSDNSDQSDHYAERYKAFYDAIKAVYPDMVMIGNVEAWGTDTPSWRNPYPVDAVDEHYYRNPSWFESNYSKYDSYDRSKHKIYVGEYAVTQDFGTTGNLNAALGEAVYMMGMENNSDVVVMNSYAPIFVNENDQKWMPDMIRFTSNTAYGTPSYYVQQLMPNYVGKQNTRFTERGNGSADNNCIGLSTWATSATFDNVKVTDANGNVILFDDFASESGKWTSNGGAWKVANGVLTQTDQGMQGAIYYNNTPVGDHYTLELEATKDGGAEGFLIAFKYADNNNYAWWNLGGWANTNHAVEVCTNGSKSNAAFGGGSLVNGHTYKVKVIVEGAHVQCILDGEMMYDVTLPVQRKLYFASSIDDDDNYLYVKVANTSNTAQPAVIRLANATPVEGEIVVLTSASGNDENDSANPYKVVPVKDALTGISGQTIEYTAPAFSFTILKVKLSDITMAQGGTPASDERVAEEKASIKDIMSRLNFMHTSMALPTGTPNAKINWMLNNDKGGYVYIGISGWSQVLNVMRLPEGESMVAGQLVGMLTFADGTVGKITYDITLAPEDTDYGYLYCFMKSTQEVTNFALGTKEDLGHKFNVLLGGKEVFDTKALAEIEHGTRDAYLQKGQRADEYFITTTDMCNANSGVWSNYGMNLLRSTDMIHWEGTTFDFRKGKQIFSDASATTDAYKTDAEYAKIYRVWAPQFIWDPTKEAYLVYYSILSSNSGDNYDKIYYSYADKDFKTLTQPRLFFDPGFAVIDGDIIYSPYDGLYHMFYKREGAGGGDRGIYEAVSPVLVGAQWKDILHVTNEGSELVEGSSAVRRINEDYYNLYYMRYTGGSAYKVSTLDHAGLNVSSSFDLRGTGNFQHGSVLTINEKEYKMLEAWNEIMPLLEWAKGVQATGSQVVGSAIAQAETALAFTTVDALYAELPKAIDALKDAKEAYLAELVAGKDKVDLTSLIINPQFTNGAEGWLGTPFTATSAGVAEQFNKTYDTYQVLERMPAGVYTLSCQGFYRAGARSVAYAAHQNGKEELNAMLYINDSAVPFMSLYDSSVSYTNTPYTYPDNVSTANSAFNTDKNYDSNEVSVTLTETSDLRFGIKKDVLISNDWNCFDNFRLVYTSIPEGVEAVESAESDVVDVYSISGVKVRSQVSGADALDGLQPGFYLKGARKAFVK